MPKIMPSWGHSKPFLRGVKWSQLWVTAKKHFPKRDVQKCVYMTLKTIKKLGYAFCINCETMENTI